MQTYQQHDGNSAIVHPEQYRQGAIEVNTTGHRWTLSRLDEEIGHVSSIGNPLEQRLSK